MHLDLGGAVSLHRAVRECRNRLQFREHTAFGIVGKRGEGARDLIDNVRVLSVWMKREMARARTGGNFRERRIIGRQLPLFRVEAVNKQLVESEVGGDGESVVGIDVDRMRVRFALACLFTLEPVC